MRRAVVFLLAALAVAPGQGALAQTPDDVIPDPRSPSGVEYELPLGRARSDATPDRRDRNGDESRGGSTTEAGGSSGEDEPLFGAGLSPDERAGAREGKTDSSSRERERSGAKARVPIETDISAGTASKALIEGDDSGTFPIVALVLATLFAALGVGVLIRRARHSG